MNTNSNLFHRNFEIVKANTPELIDIAHQLRYQVYCEEKSFEDASQHPDRREYDDYDGRAVHSLIKHKASDIYIGVVRLILPRAGDADALLPIEEHCQLNLEQTHPHLAALPRHAIGEISRFSVSKVYRRRVTEQGLIWGVCQDGESYNSNFHPYFNRRHLPMITLGLIAASFHMCEEHNVHYCYAAMEPTLLRLLQGVGINFQPLGMPVDYHGMRLPAFYPVRELMPKVLHTRPELREIYYGAEWTHQSEEHQAPRRRLAAV